MNTKELKIKIPEGYEIDKENSTLEYIKFRPAHKVEIWSDLKKISGAYIDLESKIKEEYIDNYSDVDNAYDYNKSLFIDKKHAKSAIAMAQISQLMPYYGGIITDDEWHNDTIKYCVHCWLDTIAYEDSKHYRYFLSFHTQKQRDKFMSHPENIQLIKDYFMID